MATLLIASAVSQGATEPVSTSGPMLSQDEVALAITLETRAAANAVEPGDHVSVVAVGDDGFSSIVAESARVLKTASGGGFGASDAAVTLAVDEASALRLASASARGTLTVMIRPPNAK